MADLKRECPKPERPDDRKALLQEIKQIAERVAKMPVIDNRNEEEILGYNE